MNLNLLRDLIADARAESLTLSVDAETARRSSRVPGVGSVGGRTPFVERLREGRVDDADFDDVYPGDVREVSSTFWTPVRVAMRAAQLLVQGPSTRVLDVGSGAGKFCIVGAATTGAQFIGVEHRGHLVEVARAAAACLGVTSAQFVHGTFDTVDLSTFDAIYLFNPFEENVWARRSWMDDTVELSRARFVADVQCTERLLASARPGTRVVTYHGFGGQMPRSYRLLLEERCYTSQLDLWVRGDDPVSPRDGTSNRPCDALSTASPSIANGVQLLASVDSAKRATCPPAPAGPFIAYHPPDVLSRDATARPPVRTGPP